MKCHGAPKCAHLEAGKHPAADSPLIQNGLSTHASCAAGRCRAGPAHLDSEEQDGCRCTLITEQCRRTRSHREVGFSRYRPID